MPFAFSLALPLLAGVFPPTMSLKENIHPKGGMGGRHAATTQGFKERSVVLALANPNPWSSASFYLRSPSPLERKKENRHAKGGMGGRHAATTQGEECGASRRPPTLGSLPLEHLSTG